ncbi:MAG: hypothetical protein QOJ56_471 [Mycobacterium sp.]|jgi:aryl-alcohol dehydrogenase-like predicted oxidoreductase|nr:hypothetical protein [Mycobacterium sp.]
MFVRNIEREVLPTCQRYGMGVIAWSPLNAGWLSGSRKRSADATGVVTRRSKLMLQLFDLSDDGEAYKFDLLEELEALAGSIGMPLRQMALAWTLEHPAVTSAIIGLRTMEHLDGLVDADRHRLPAPVLDRIDELIPPGTSVSRIDDRRNEPWLTEAGLRRRSG